MGYGEREHNFPSLGGRKLRDYFLSFKVTPSLPYLRKWCPSHFFLSPSKERLPPNATNVEKALKFKDKRIVYALKSALTQVHIKITWEAFGKYKCTELISGDSGSLGLHWGAQHLLPPATWRCIQWNGWGHGQLGDRRATYCLSLSGYSVKTDVEDKKMLLFSLEWMNEFIQNEFMY